MKAVRFSTVRNNFREYCDMAVDDLEPVIVTRDVGRNVVILSEDAYNNMLENIYVRQDPVVYARLLQAKEDEKKGIFRGSVRELIEVDDG